MQSQLDAPPRSTPLGALRLRPYRLWFVTNNLSLAGTGILWMAIAWATLQSTHSATVVGLVVALQYLPVLALGIWPGTLADRFDRRKWLLGLQSSMTLAAVVLVV